MLSILFLATVINYSPPVNYNITLAGNFAEPRPNHFHGGIDIKTGGVTGKAVFAVADGYVTEASIGVGGYGNALYVRHPDGHTSAYFHLLKFMPQIQAEVRQWQYRHKQTTGVMTFGRSRLPVARGQLIAISGNSGASQAPHLHLEIHDTHTGDLLDPLDFVGSDLQDTYAPLGHAFMVYPIRGEGTFCGGGSKQSYGFSSHNLKRQFTAWGRVGFGIWSNDYSETTYNRLGTRKVELFVDGKLHFRSDASRIPPSMNMMVNAWGDYEHSLRSRVWYMRSYVRQGVRLPFFTVGNDQGIVNFNDERDYNLMFVLTDYKGNASRYTFTVRGEKRQPQKRRKPDVMTSLWWNRPCAFVMPGMVLTLGRNALPDDLELQPIMTRRPDALSNRYRLMPSSHPLFKYASISIRLNHKVNNPEKLYIRSSLGKNRYMGGNYKDGWVTGRARELAADYEIALDNTPPTIKTVWQNTWSASRRITIALSDVESGLKHFAGYVDGQFVAFDGVGKTALVRCNLEETPIKKTGASHHLRVIAEDHRGNKRTIETSFKY